MLQRIFLSSITTKTDSQDGRMTSNDRSPSCFSLSGVRRSNGGPQFSNFREDKENQGPHEDEDEDGPILYREDDSMEEEGDACSITLTTGMRFQLELFSDRLAAKLARKESLSMKLQQRPGKQELIDRNILYQVTEEERKHERNIIGAKLIRRLSLRPTPEELEERNILKSRNTQH